MCGGECVCVCWIGLFNICNKNLNETADEVMVACGFKKQPQRSVSREQEEDFGKAEPSTQNKSLDGNQPQISISTCRQPDPCFSSRAYLHCLFTSLLYFSHKLFGLSFISSIL